MARRGADQFELLVIDVKQSVRARRDIAAATTRTPLGHNPKFATAASAVTRATCDGINPTVSGALRNSRSIGQVMAGLNAVGNHCRRCPYGCGAEPVKGK